MKKDFLLEFLLFLPISLVVLLVKVLPIKVLLNLGAAMGFCAYMFSFKRRRICQTNLKAAFPGQLSADQREKIVKQVFKNFGLNIIELFLMPRMDKNFFAQYTRIENIDRAAQALQKKRGLIFLSAHYGNWEICASISAYNGYKMLGLARVQKPLFLNAMLNKYRENKGTTVIQKGFQVKEILRHLHKNGIVGFIGDQSGRTGVQVSLFGRPVFMADGAFRIAANSGCVILPAFNLRKDNGFSHQLILENPIVIRPNEDKEEFVRRGVREYTALLEKYIREHPHLWLWGNRRWKHTSARTVLILSDGKIGHLRQCQSVAMSIAGQTDPVTVKEIEIRFKNAWAEKLFTFIMLYFLCFIPRPLRCLRFFLAPELWAQLEGQFCDIVVCGGSLTRAVALCLAKENMAKSISVMRPAPFAVKRFDLCVIPAHDDPRPGRRVLVTSAALNLITPEYLALNAKKMREHFALSEKKKIGVIIGGDAKDCFLAAASVRTVLEQVKTYAVREDREIILTTSRRTPSGLEAMIAQIVADCPACVLKIFPSRQNYDFVIGGMLALCSAVVVSGESISMVSEAVTAGVNTVVFPPQKKAGLKTTKYERFLRQMNKRGFIKLSVPEGVGLALDDFSAESRVPPLLDDRRKLEQALRAVILR